MRLVPLNFWINIYSSGSRGEPEERPPPEHNFISAEIMRINSRENFNFSLNFSKFLLKFS